MNFIKTIFISITILSMTSLYYGMCPCVKSECMCSYLYPSGYDTVMVDYISLLNTSQYFYHRCPDIYGIWFPPPPKRFSHRNF